jgi:hypothetical protein
MHIYLFPSLVPVQVLLLVFVWEGVFCFIMVLLLNIWQAAEKKNIIQKVVAVNQGIYASFVLVKL